jgi:hypothetical protein
MNNLEQPLNHNKKILFVSHRRTHCGVYEFGKDIIDILQSSQKYNFIPTECSSLNELKALIAQHQPDGIIYNYHPITMPWLSQKILPRLFWNRISKIKIPQIGIIHEVTQAVADNAIAYRNQFLINRRLNNSLFDFYITPDPSLRLFNPLVYKTGRLIKRYEGGGSPAIFTIGSFGFGTSNKGFGKIVALAEKTLPEALIRFNIPSADFVDKNGDNARKIARDCQALIKNPKIKLTVTHDFLNDEQLRNFLAGNTINIFLYGDNGDRGLSSAVDVAMSVKKPIAISSSSMFRHIRDLKPSICVEKNDLLTIANNGFAPLWEKYQDWSPENLCWDYERILNNIFNQRPEKNISIRGKIKNKVYRLLQKPQENFSWLRDSSATEENTEIEIAPIKYQAISLGNDNSFNRILDEKARQLYAPAEKMLSLLAPKIYAQKIVAANIQQAFVFDTVWRLLPENTTSKILCVGSYEDTAALSLKKMGLKIEEIDPVSNYSLREYMSKPTTILNSYQLIFSTSVIEHVGDDETFIKDIAALLAPGGTAIITCDYLENWQAGQDKPMEDERLYTKNDLQIRLLELIPDCELIDTPHWSCPEPDFQYGPHRYAFATLVFKKKDKSA